MDKITVLVLDHNGSEYTIDCVKNLFQFNHENIEVYILMNGSEASHVMKVHNEFSNNSSIYIYESSENLGFAGGMNYLFTIVVNSMTTNYILLLNNDALVSQNTLHTLWQVISADESIGLVFPRVLGGNGDRKYIVEDGLEFYPSIMQQSPINYGVDPEKCPGTGISDMPIANATCVMIKKKLMQELNGFDEIYFAYFEDWDFCFRMRKLGKRIVLVSDTWVWHAGSATTGTGSKKYQFLMTRNRFICSKRYLSTPVFYLVFFPYFISIKVAFKCAQLLLKGHLQGLMGVLLALLWLMSPAKLQHKLWPFKHRI